jgi:hypothetical protein
MWYSGVTLSVQRHDVAYHSYSSEQSLTLIFKIDFLSLDVVNLQQYYIVMKTLRSCSNVTPSHHINKEKC